VVLRWNTPFPLQEDKTYIFRVRYRSDEAA
jgi:hypothetical protein